MVRGLGVSGMGRIGRLLIRRLLSGSYEGLPLKTINTIYPVETVAHLLKYDTVHGHWNAEIQVLDGKLVINGHAIEVTFEREPENIPWQRLGVDLVIDATGKFNHREGAAKHLKAGASHVLITAPGRDMDLTVVMGVNDDMYDPAKHKLVSAASCTTNCVSPLLHLLDQAFGVRSGWMTTVHAFTSDQNHLDNPHADLRRARACTQSMIPTSTGVGKALRDVLPHLAPHVQGVSIRVPTQDVSLVDLTVELSDSPSLERVKDVFRNAADGAYSAYVGYSDEPLVSADYVGCSKSAVVDGLSLQIMNNQLKVLAWYDNEWAYSCRVVDLAYHIKEGAESAWKSPQFA